MAASWLDRQREPQRTASAGSDTTALVLTRDELWLLQAVVRHEHAAQETWRYPYASRELNDQIAEAILFCEDQNQPEASLLVSWGDCLIIDYCVPQTAKDVNGKPIGRTVLLKTYQARAALKRGYPLPERSEEAPPSKQDVRRWVQELEDSHAYDQRYPD